MLHWKWVIVFASFFLSFLTDGIRFSFGLTYKELLAEFNAGKGATAGIGSLMFGMMNFTAPLASILINKYGCRLTVMLGSVIQCVGLVATSLAPNFYFLYFSFGIICGIGYSMMYVPTSVIILQYFDKKKSFANGLAMCGSGVGGFVFNPMLNALFSEYTWRGALLATSGIVLQGAVAGALMRPHSSTTAEAGDTKKLIVKQDSNTISLIDDDNKDGDSLNGPDNHNVVNTPSAKELQLIANKLTQTNIINDSLQLEVKQPAANLFRNKFVRSSEMIFNFANQENLDRLDKLRSSSVPNMTLNKYEISTESHELETKLESNKVVMRSRQSLAGQNNKDEINSDTRISGVYIIPSNNVGGETKLDGESGKSTETLPDNQDLNHKEKRKSIFAWYILKDPKFIFFMTSQFFLAHAYMIPYTYLPEVVISLGYSRPKAVWLMSTISIISTLSRAASGWLADRRFINRRILFCTANLICAAAVASMFFCKQYELIVFASIIYGLCTGCIIATIAIIVADLFGPRLLSDAYGLSIFGRTPGNLSGPPLSGWIVDKTGRLDLVFLVSGTAFLLGGISIVMSVRAKDRLTIEDRH